MVDNIRVGILTISDRCSAGTSPDLSGPAIRETLPSDAYQVVLYACVPDEKPIIQDTLKRWADECLCDVLLTTGGTGVAQRDVTPEATEKILERRVPAIATHIYLASRDQTPFACLSRGTAGTRGRTMIINLPGSPSGARDGTRALLPVLAHAVALVRGDNTSHGRGDDNA